MHSLCRLCATCSEPTELTTEISAIEPKLALCCGWQATEHEIKMPKKACNFCVDRLQMSWNFVEQIWAAEKQLNKLFNEQIQTKSEEVSPQTMDIKAEDGIEPNIAICELEELKSPFDENVADADDSNDFDGGGIFGEPIDHSNDESSHSNDDQKKKSPKRIRKKRRPLDPFIAALAPGDCLDGGLVSTNAIQKLENLFPNMKTVSWTDLEYKCDKCNRSFLGSHHFYTHIRSFHIEEVSSIKVPCVYCNTKYRRELRLNRHIATEHFEHLKYR